MFVQQTWLHCYAATSSNSITERRDGWKGAGDIRIYKLASKKGLHLPSRDNIFLHPVTIVTMSNFPTSNAYWSSSKNTLTQSTSHIPMLAAKPSPPRCPPNKCLNKVRGHQLAFRILKIHSAYKFQNHPSMITCKSISDFSMLHTQLSV